MPRLPLYIVDAFADRPFAGNPAAVVPLEEWLPAPVLQAIAAEHNLSETAFVLAGPDGLHLRWFTPAIEVELCGHATLATAFVLATERGLAPPFAFRTHSGELRVTREGDLFVLEDQPLLVLGRVVQVDPVDVVRGPQFVGLGAEDLAVEPQAGLLFGVPAVECNHGGPWLVLVPVT